jgi:hypothetical protein
MCEKTLITHAQTNGAVLTPPDLPLLHSDEVIRHRTSPSRRPGRSRWRGSCAPRESQSGPGSYLGAR